MEQRLSLVTLGVTDIDRARRFYEALGWSGESPDGEVYFFQAGGMVVALWSRSKLAADSVVTDGGGWGGVTLAHNVASPEAVDVVLAEAEAAGATIGRAGAATPWGGYSGALPRSRRTPVGGGPQPVLGAGGGRVHPPALSLPPGRAARGRRQRDRASSMKARAAGESGASRWISPSCRCSAGRSDATTAPCCAATAAIGRGTTAAPAPASTRGTMASR